jgi:hypothetical protein
MTPSERENYYDRLYSQAISTSLNFNLNKIFLELNLNDNKQRHWRPIDGVGEIAVEEFVGNYMVDSNKSVGHFL